MSGYLTKAPNDLVSYAIGELSKDPFYREWFSWKEKFYNPMNVIYLVNYSNLNPFSPTGMRGTGVNYYPFEFSGSFYVATGLSWYCWKNLDLGRAVGNNNLAITQVPEGLYREIKTQGKKFALKLTTGQHNTPFNDEFKKRGENIQ